MAKIPKTFGACADRLYTLRAARAQLTRQAEEIEAEEKAIKEHLINNLSKQDQTGAVGHTAKAQITTKVVPSVKDWDAVYKFILKTKDFSILGRRLVDTAVRERWDAGQKLPGVESFTAVSVSVTKV